MVPVSVLEGITTTDNTGSYIPFDAAMNHEVHALHYLAKRGLIPSDVAERQLNSYLAAASADLVVRAGVRPRALLLPLADTPHHTLLPDLGNVTHNILAKTPIPGALSFVLEQSMPSLRHTQRACQFKDFQDVLLNLVLAFLLGLYQGSTVKRPDFACRCALYARIHALLTSTRMRQTSFCAANQPLLVVACMEYVARVLPVYMPAQAAYLNARDPSCAQFFRRIPTLCDELRQGFDSTHALSWRQLQASCLSLIDKVSRLRKAGSLAPMRDISHATASQLAAAGDVAVIEHWKAPMLNTQSPSEYRLLAEALGLNDGLLRIIQRHVQLYPLPSNLRRMQVQALARHGGGNARSAYLATRLPVCAYCIVAGRSIEHTRLRLNTLTEQLLCSFCARDDLISIDMLGRVLRHKQNFFIMCPSCTKIRPYKGEQVWSDEPCAHATQQRRQKIAPKPRHPCIICSETTVNASVERVDHLSGVMRSFVFCQRHMPRLDALRNCMNARQLETQYG